MSDSQDGQHVKTPDYFINPIGVLQQIIAMAAWPRPWVSQDNAMTHGFGLKWDR